MKLNLKKIEVRRQLVMSGKKFNSTGPWITAETETDYEIDFSHPECPLVSPVPFVQEPALTMMEMAKLRKEDKKKLLSLPNVPKRSQPMGWDQRGPLMWAELHKIKGADQQWMMQFTRRIPCGSCKQHWYELLKQNPPPYGDDDAFYKWTVMAHNLVNERLGKPLFQL